MNRRECMVKTTINSNISQAYVIYVLLSIVTLQIIFDVYLKIYNP